MRNGARDFALEDLAMSARGRAVVARRCAFVALVVLTVVPLTVVMLEMIRINGATPLEYVILSLTALLLVPIAISFWMAVFGFVVQAVRGRRAVADPAGATTLTEPFGFSTAIIVPIYNEDPQRVVAALAATRKSLARTGRLESFDFFVLSDTMDPQRWIDEELAIAAFRNRLPDPARLHYRNRLYNEAKKPGNIADFCRTHGDRYRYMIVFDADSLMGGATMTRLVELMERHPDVGIIQVPAVPVNRRSLFGRLQQFAASVYGPTWSAGLAYLQCGEGNYYGHNAIVRVAPFREHCRLPTLPGEAPLGGHVLSHDFIEAALMRRAGFKVYLASELGDSYEEAPPTLIDYSVRDRRWCQGNLQHMRLLGMPGLHPISRIHLLLGVMSYLASPLWMLLLLISTAEALHWKLTEHEYFAPGESLFPIWEISIRTQASLLFLCVSALLFLPRALALLSRLRSRSERALFGGGLRLVASCVGECLFSMLLAPVLAVTQTQFVASILMGRNSGWNSQARSDTETTPAQALRRHAGVTLLGLVWSALLLLFSIELFWWMLPVLAGMVLSIPLSVWSSRISMGRWARHRGLLLTPEEVEPPAVLQDLRKGLARPATWDTRGTRGALDHVLADPVARDAHFAFVLARRGDPLEEHALEGLVLKCRLLGPRALTDLEQRALLLAPHALSALLEPAVAPPQTAPNEAVAGR